MPEEYSIDLLRYHIYCSGGVPFFLSYFSLLFIGLVICWTLKKIFQFSYLTWHNLVLSNSGSIDVPMS